MEQHISIPSLFCYNHWIIQFHNSVIFPKVAKASSSSRKTRIWIIFLSLRTNIRFKLQHEHSQHLVKINYSFLTSLRVLPVTAPGVGLNSQLATEPYIIPFKFTLFIKSLATQTRFTQILVKTNWIVNIFLCLRKRLCRIHCNFILPQMPLQMNLFVCREQRRRCKTVAKGAGFESLPGKNRLSRHFRIKYRVIGEHM